MRRMEQVAALELEFYRYGVALFEARMAALQAAGHCADVPVGSRPASHAGPAGSGGSEHEELIE